MSTCEVLYRKGDKGTLLVSVDSYLETKSFAIFKSDLVRGEIPKEVRVTVNQQDSDEDIHKTLRTLYTDLYEIVVDRIRQQPSNEPVLMKLLQEVENKFHIDVDRTQSTSIDSDEETNRTIKNKDELFDVNRNNLRKHYDEIYGLGAYDITMSLEQDFYDYIMEVAYHNIRTGESVEIKDSVLNSNIDKLRGRLHSVIKSYLDSVGVKYGDSNIAVQQAFYNHIMRLPNKRDVLDRLHAEKIKQTNRNDRSAIFKSLLEELSEDPEFAKEIPGLLKDYGRNRLTNNLYRGDCYSPSYLAVRDYVRAHRSDLKDRIEKIEALEINLLEATNAYSILTHFDQLLLDRMGTVIAVQRGTFGVEAANKYSYSQDDAHEVKGWQTSEDIGSERHTAKFTHGVFSQIRIYDHKTDVYKNRRLDSTSFIVAARHLIDDIVYGNITFKSNTPNNPANSANVTRAGNTIKSLITTFHDSPERNLQQILEILFETPKREDYEYVKDCLANKKLLTDYDLDILYSVYSQVFDKSNKFSFIRQEIDGYYVNKLGAGLMQEVASYVDRNITMDYLETEIDQMTGNTVLKIKKKFFNQQELNNLRKKLNSGINGKSEEARAKIQSNYKFNQNKGQTTLYTVEIGGVEYTLSIDNAIKPSILTSSSNSGKIVFTNPDLFDMFNGIDFVKFRHKIETGAELSADNHEDKFKQLLEFIDDTLDLNILSNTGLQALQLLSKTYTQIGNMSHYLMPLVQLAIRAAYINKQYLDAKGANLREYLKYDPIFNHYLANTSTRLFSEMYGDVKYMLASYADSILDQWVDCISILSGSASKATTKDSNNNSIPNNSVGKLGGMLYYYTHKQKDTNCDSLEFVQNPNSVKRTLHDLEVSNVHRDFKSVRDLSCGELFYHAIFNKFWGQYVQKEKNRSVIIQPTVYSDKTTFLNWEVQTDLLEDPNYAYSTLLKYKETIGTFYKKIYNSTINKYSELFDINPELTLEEKATLVRSHLKNHTLESLMQLRDSRSVILNKNIELEKDKDYRVRYKTVTVTNELEETITRKIEYCDLNEILEYNARVYNDEELLTELLERQKYEFLKHLIDYGASYQVIDFNDKYKYYTGDIKDAKASSKNAIITTILKIYNTPKARKEFFTKWVDSTTGKLILAKQNGVNILGIGEDFDSKSPGMELNPLLDKFFYVEGFLSNNLRLSLTGSEINHPDKSSDHLYKSIISKDYGDFKKEIPVELSFGEYQQVIETLKRVNDVSELYDEASPIIVADENIGISSKVSTPVKDALMYLYHDSILTSTNISQGAQFKRNVIIPATLQYCQQNNIYGIPSQIKGCVIKDLPASVFNYRGETKNVDSADGSAKITPFESIMENLSLGSQAVGFTKKPIWHSYDANGGTAFLAKFATNTMTNEEMKMSLHSKSNEFKLFQKMTDLNWDEPIDLTKPMHFANSVANSEDAGERSNYESWFKSVILEGSRLFYENEFGERVEILGLNKTISDGNTYYYTIEKVVGSVLAKPTKVYHMFYDSVDQNGNKTESVHVTFDTYQKVNAFKAANEGSSTITNIRTINSLFHLHTALGSINCVDQDGNSSEFNNKVVVNYMNNIGNRRPGVSKKDWIDQLSYYQPLKKYHIGYAFNETAVKNGIKNINGVEAWSGDAPLRYFEIDSSGLGMQMNADHDIINSELTEFSQVVAATSAYAYTYDNCDEIFKGLAKTAIQASRHVLQAVDNFLDGMSDEAHSALYDAIGRIILTESSIKDKENLNNIIKEAVEKIFNKYKDHKNDAVKLPFSDSNVYSDFIATLASAINKASIKRKHPGSGCVMVPGYDIITYFEVGDKKYNPADILRIARKDLEQDLKQVALNSAKYDVDSGKYGKLKLKSMSLRALMQYPELIEALVTSEEDLEGFSNTSDATKFNKFIVNRYLDKLQKNAPIKDKSYFQPEDVVIVIEPTINPETGAVEMRENRIVLDSMSKYVAFKEYDYPKGTLFQVDVKTPRNLKPSLARWRYEDVVDLDQLKVHKSEVYDKPWKDDPTKYNKAFALSLEEDPLRIFEIVKDVEDGFWSIHFKTILNGETFETAPALTEEQKMRLFRAAAAQIPLGDKLSTWGSLTRGGISGLNRFRGLGFDQIGTRTVSDREGNPIEIPVFEKVGNYMNIFDHSVIRDAFKKNGKLDSEHRSKVQNILHNLHEGFFEKDGIRYNIIKDSMENTEAELVMSDVYKDVFGVNSETLQEILDKGEQYFIDQIHQLHAPANPIYDVALLKDNGKHTLIKFGSVIPTDLCSEDPFKDVSVNDVGEIYCMKGNRPLFKIGKYVTDDDLYIDDGIIKSKSGQSVDSDLCRIITDSNLQKDVVQKRIDFVQRYKLTTISYRGTGNQKKEVYTTNVMYKLIKPEDLMKLDPDYDETSAYKQIGSIMTEIYLQDKYKFVALNTHRGKYHIQNYHSMNSYFTWFKNHYSVNPDHKRLIDEQLKHITEDSKVNDQYLTQLQREYYIKEAHKKWVSFQDSLKFISSRIPAQTLQSFMAMKCVGWTANSKNMAYVSHFQIYLQGSDYDIDKAYIMGQSYDGNGVYIGWSPLFDYTSLKTLELSKQLPTPEIVNLRQDVNGVDVTFELEEILKYTDDDINPINDDVRVELLKNYVSILKKINRYKGAINYTTEDSIKLQKVFKLLKSHIFYKIPENIAEAAYKNVASANIYAVSHDIRNRDQGYTAITMRNLSDAAAKSPKGKQAAALNMLNPLTKYIMQYQNIVGKNVIGIAANGEKVWFNTYYYWTKLLKEGKADKLKFRTTLSRVEGRYNKKIKPRTVKHLPDLNTRDLAIKEALINELDIDVKNEVYKYVDQLISQLLSAATDNAKELILAKINAGSNFARMYVYLIMTGYDLDDIVQFMICPTSEFIDSMSNSNMFQDSDMNNSPHKAIKLSMGSVRSKDFLHGNINKPRGDEDDQFDGNRSTSKTKFITQRLKIKDKYDVIIKTLQDHNLLKDLDEDLSLDKLMQGYILAAISDSSIDIRNLTIINDFEINSYLHYCQNLVYKLRHVVSKYQSDLVDTSTAISEMLVDAAEFNKIYNLATEISNISSAWLGLNQGIPTDELSMLKRFESMRKVITDQERALGLYDSQMFTDSTKDKDKDKADKYLEEVIQAIWNNNQNLTIEYIRTQLEKAHANKLIGTFDVYRYLTDTQYRQNMIEYGHLIKGTVNVLDMMEEIPHYKEIINCLKSVAVSKNALASKSRMITELANKAGLTRLNDDQLKGVIRFVDRLNAFNFARSLKKTIILDKSIVGFKSDFSETTTSEIDLSTFEGLATFKHWIEFEFLEELKQDYKDNPLVKHLVKTPDNVRDILATDIDLLHPNVTSLTRLSYDEILKGMALFENIPYKNTELSIADLLQLYNIIVNCNQYGSERLTTAFKACYSENNILNKFFKFIGTQDYDLNFEANYELEDYYINAAPLVNTGSVRFKTDKYIKVNDPVQGYILMHYNIKNNTYSEWPLMPPSLGPETLTDKLKRRRNFAEFCPFEMPNMANVNEKVSILKFDANKLDDQILMRLKKLLIDYSTSGKLLMLKQC